MQPRPRKAVVGAPADKTVLLYVLSPENQLVERARQLGVEAVAVPTTRTLVNCTEEVWSTGKSGRLWVTALLVPVLDTGESAVSRFELFLWTKEAGGLLKRAPALSRRMLHQGRRIARVDNNQLELLEGLVC